MPYQVSVSGTTGTPPYDLYVCDITNTYCYLSASGVTISPPYTFYVSPPLDVVESLIIKILDSNGCERFEVVSCLLL